MRHAWPRPLTALSSRARTTARRPPDLVERALREEDLREGEEHFRVIANSAPVLIWMSGTDEEITSFDQPWLDYAAARGAAVGNVTGNAPLPG